MAASSNDALGTDSVSILEPRGAHRATIVWLHDVDEDKFNSIEFVDSLQLRNIKWICLDSGTSIYTISGDEVTYKNAWFNMTTNGDVQDELDGLDNASMRVADILSNEPASVLKGVAGVGLGAGVALHFATKCALRQCPITLRLAIGINGCLSTYQSLKSKIESEDGAASRAASQSILLTHGRSNPIIPPFYVNKSVEALRESGFGEVSLVEFPMLGREITMGVVNVVKAWLKEKLPLDP